MPVGMGKVEPTGLTIALDDFARSTARWSALIGAEPVVTDLTRDGRKRKRLAGRSFDFDLVEAAGRLYAGDSTLTLFAHDLNERAAALTEAGVSFQTDEAAGRLRIGAPDANGVSVVLSSNRPARLEPPMAALPYVIDIAVVDMERAVPVWAAILGDPGVATPIETDSARQFRMHHYLVDGETHAIGLMALDQDQFIKRDSLGSSQEYILRTHGEGALCVGFLFKTDLDEHIAQLAEQVRTLLLFEEPRSYLMGRNNMSHADQTGGVAVVIAQHFEGWEGDLRGVEEMAEASGG